MDVIDPATFQKLLQQKADANKTIPQDQKHGEAAEYRRRILQDLEKMPSAEREVARLNINTAFASVHGPDWLGPVQAEVLTNDNMMNAIAQSQFPQEGVPYLHAPQINIADQTLTF